MFLFKKNKKEEIKESTIIGSFISSVLINSSTNNLDMFLNIFKEDWNIEIDKDKISINEDSIILEIDGIIATIAYMPFPVPNNEAVEAAKTNYSWDNATVVAKEHKAHLIVAVIKGEQLLIAAAELYVKICASCLRLPNTVGLFTLGTLMHPGAYIELAKVSLIEEKTFPIMNLVFIGLYSNDSGKTCSAYTNGMQILGKKNIEIIDSTNNVSDVHNFLLSIVSYIIESNVILKDGETIGFSEEQKLKITETKGIAINTLVNTLKIDY